MGPVTVFSTVNSLHVGVLVTSRPGTGMVPPQFMIDLPCIPKLYLQIAQCDTMYMYEYMFSVSDGEWVNVI